MARYNPYENTTDTLDLAALQVPAEEPSPPPPAPPPPCPLCRGSGRVETTVWTVQGWQRDPLRCEACGGSGHRPAPPSE